VEGSGPQEQSELLHSLLDTDSMLGWEIWPGWWSAKSRPLGPWAESGEKTACRLLVCVELKPCGEYGSFAYDVRLSLLDSLTADPGDSGVIGVL
jgi:hypothetical protein